MKGLFPVVHTGGPSEGGTSRETQDTFVYIYIEYYEGKKSNGGRSRNDRNVLSRESKQLFSPPLPLDLSKRRAGSRKFGSPSCLRKENGSRCKRCRWLEKKNPKFEFAFVFLALHPTTPHEEERWDASTTSIEGVFASDRHVDMDGQINQ
jgi:hypothetical protein